MGVVRSLRTAHGRIVLEAVWDSSRCWKELAAMRINQNTVLQGKRVALVPYTSAHVPRYHEWMKSEELQRLTASEPLSLEQEYEMQCNWREDTDSEVFGYLPGLENGVLSHLHC
ncbi:UNVERIFIED_CONTAM: hypothetical protein K2H54_016311 [Gekko kuhli]